MTTIEFTIDGDRYPFEATFLYSEAVLIKRLLGMNMSAFGRATVDGDPEAIGFMVWLAKRRKLGPDACGRFEDLDFDLTEVMNALAEPDGAHQTDQPESTDRPSSG